jgi:hypothetical protein
LFSRDTSEVIENRLAVNSDYEFVGSLPRSRTTQEIPSSAQVKSSSCDVASTAVSNKNQTNDKGKFILPLENGSPGEHLNDVVGAVVISNRQAVSVPSKVNGEMKDIAPDREGKIQSEMIKGKEQRKIDIGLSTEIVPEQKSGTSQPETKAEVDHQYTRLKVT